MPSYAEAVITANSRAKLKSKSSLGRDLAAGALAGQVAGLIMAIALMVVFTAFLEEGPVYPLQVIGSFIYGDPAVRGFHFPTLLVGLLLHQFGPSLFWGVILGSVVHALGVRRGVIIAGLGIVTALVSQLVDVNLIMPLAMKALHGHDIWAEQVPALWSWAAHLVFGLALTSYLWAHQRLRRERAVKKP